MDNKSIFNSITQIDDEEIKFYDDDDDKIPSTISIMQLLDNYVCENFHFHLSISSLVKIILDNTTTIAGKIL